MKLLKLWSNKQQTDQPMASEPALSRSNPTVPDEQSRVRQKTVYILVVGRSGSGKTRFIRTACSNPKQSEAKSPHCGTVVVESHILSSVDKEYGLIDTPGFDNVDLSDEEIFQKIADHLQHPQIVKQGISGIIYIHPAGEALRSRTLQRNLRLFLDMFLGETEQNRLTILVTQRTMYKEDVEVVANEMRRQDSMIFSEAIARGARIAATRSDWRKSECIDVLRAYSSRGSISPPIHRAELRDSLPRFRACSCAEEAVGYRKKETTCAESRFPAYDEQIEKLNSSLEESNANLTHHQKIIEQLRADQQITESVLNQRIQAVQEEYASLRSQVQLQDNSEQEDIVQTLLGLNRCIEDFGTQISTYLVENHVQVAFGKNSSNLTTLDAHRLSKLRSWFGYDGKPSLIEPSAGVGLEIDDFFDFSIRHLLCLVLATYIFRPFHPCIPSSESERFIEVYEEVQKQESQYMAGKWRSIAFKSVNNGGHSRTVTDVIAKLQQHFVQNCLDPLIGYFSGRGLDAIPLERQHLDSLYQIFKRACDWNSKLKADVIMLGDFEPIIYEPCSEFNSETMEEFEPNAGKTPARSILGTLGLGLVSWRAVGGGRPSEKMIVCKAMVVTDNFYLKN